MSGTKTGPLGVEQLEDRSLLSVDRLLLIAGFDGKASDSPQSIEVHSLSSDTNADHSDPIPTETLSLNFDKLQLSRAGQQVVVDFLEGDPDRPIVLGRLYGVGDDFSPAKDDDPDHLFIHRLNAVDVEVENDETHWVGHDRSGVIDRHLMTLLTSNRTETVDNNETITIGGARTEYIGEQVTFTARIHPNSIAPEGSSLTSSKTVTPDAGGRTRVLFGSDQGVWAAETGIIIIGGHNSHDNTFIIVIGGNEGGTSLPSVTDLIIDPFNAARK